MSDGDLDDIAALLADPVVMAHYPRPRTREEAQAWIDWTRASYRDHGFGLWVLVERSTGRFLGDCGLTVQQIAELTSWRSATTSAPIARMRAWQPKAHLQSAISRTRCCTLPG